MRSFLFLASLLSLSWARTLLVQTEDEATTTGNGKAQIDELFEEPISIYSEYEDNGDSDHASEEPGNSRSRKKGKGTNRKITTVDDCKSLSCTGLPQECFIAEIACIAAVKIKEKN